MENIFIYAGVISAIYFIVKFIEMKYVDQESKPLKLLVRDTVMVYASVILGDFVMGQVGSKVNDVLTSSVTPEVFNDTPDF
jgi:hypothetical protein